MQICSTRKIRNCHHHLNERTVIPVGIYEPVQLLLQIIWKIVVTLTLEFLFPIKINHIVNECTIYAVHTISDEH